MLNDDIKKQARDIARDGVIEQEESISISEAANMPDDARALLDAAWEKELQRREGILEENDRKYEAALTEIVADKNGKLEEQIIVASIRYEDGQQYIKLNALGYDRLPSDLQKMYGKREDVVDKWVVEPDERRVIYNEFVKYQRDNSHGYKTWEEYRDANKPSKQEETTIGKPQDVADNDKPRETPAIPVDTETFIKK